jgi:GTP cyclohydrolase I
MAKMVDMVQAAIPDAREQARAMASQLSAEEAAQVLLEQTTGLNADSPHGANTPKRFARMLKELTTPEDFEFTTFDADGMQDMIVMQDIPFVSLCNHHIVPFIGVAHIAYVPRHKMVGLSKLARTVRYHSKALQVQEKLTHDIADYLVGHLDPLGVGVVMEAEHMCMTIRGVQTPGTKTTTSTMRGVFADHNRTAKAEFMSIIGK